MGDTPPADCLTLSLRRSVPKQITAEAGEPVSGFSQETLGVKAEPHLFLVRQYARVTPIRIRQLTSQALGEANHVEEPSYRTPPCRPHQPPAHRC